MSGWQIDWMAERAFDAMVGWIAAAVLRVITGLWALLSDTVFLTPDVTGLPQVAQVSATCLAVVNVTFVLAVLSAGITVMLRETVQTRYGLAELGPRLVIGWLAANFAGPICSQAIQLTNAVTEALTGDTLAGPDSLQRLQAVTTQALTSVPDALLAAIIGVLVGVLTAALLLVWLMRIALLVFLAAVAPLALACHATPFSDAIARLWWRALAATLATVVLQGFALHTALVVFLDPQANLPVLGLPRDPSGTLNLLIVVCLLWVVVRIPALMRRYVLRGGGSSRSALVLRSLLVQQATGRLRLTRPARRAAGRTGGQARRSAGAVTVPGGPAVRLPRPVHAGTSRPRPAGARLPAPRGAGPGRVAIAWPTGRPVPPYTAEDLAAGVDLYTRSRRRPSGPPRMAASPPRIAATPPRMAPSPPRTAASPPRMAASPPRRRSSP
ncbi:hypothetical protein OWR29_39045 [Actinoplanes sp. Pm04-4]|uniref:TrbL/VirB6 plasmid conjugal transfer protein n=1 Tax=Paractinoplanes pyxinae TaxID=2997416 RepID=A0ABT4BEM8_9ACTN|nr:conjugal transfer protein TrbL family protein [Actinoplanes pyxinae]MCY1144028.1 hypothetical protein [Actinoplanes pyxinae]